MIIGKRTSKYLHKVYPKNLLWDRLQIGDKVWVHPSKTSAARKKYEAKIELREINWTTGKETEICIAVKGSHGAVLNDYGFNRLGKIK